MEKATGSESVILRGPSPFVTLSETKGLAFWLRVNSAPKNLGYQTIQCLNLSMLG